jgi:hypothetical protein
LIANIDETLTLHLIKDGAKNLSYRWFHYTKSTIRTVFSLHPIRYGICIIWRETMRKIIYPILKFIWKWDYIDTLERLPFILMGNIIKRYNLENIKNMGF